MHNGKKNSFKKKEGQYVLILFIIKNLFTFLWNTDCGPTAFRFNEVIRKKWVGPSAAQCTEASFAENVWQML